MPTDHLGLEVTAHSSLQRARALGLYDWLTSIAPGLWGTPQDIARRLRGLDAKGMSQWMFFVGQAGEDRLRHVEQFCHEVLPRLTTDD